MTQARSELRGLMQRVQDESKIVLVADQELDEYLAKIDANADCILWRSQGALAGFAAFYCNDPKGESAFLTMLAIDPERAREGMGRILLRAAIDSARVKSFKRFWLRVHSSNAAAISLYAKCGFVVIGEESPFMVMEYSL